MTSIDIYKNRDAIISPAMIEAVLNKALNQAGVKLEAERKLATDDDNKWIAFAFGNGMTVSGTVSTIRSIKAEDRRMLERLMKDKKTWEVARKYLTNLKTGMEASGLWGVGSVKGHSDAEVNIETQDKGTAEREDYSKEMNDVFRTVDGELKVASLEVSQLQSAMDNKVDVGKFMVGTFVRGTRTLKHTESLQRLKQDGAIPAFATALETQVKDLETRLKALEQKVAVLDQSQWKYTSFDRTFGTLGIKDAEINIPKLGENQTIKFKQAGKVLFAWCEYVASPGEAGKFYHIVATPDGQNVNLDLFAVPGMAACRVRVRVHVIFKNLH